MSQSVVPVIQIPDPIRNIVQKRFAKELVGKVRLVFFSQEMECQFCAQTRELMQQVASWSDKITLEVRDFVRNKEEAKALGIDKIPAVAVLGEKGSRIRFFGVPSGYEFQTLTDAIVFISSGKTQMPAAAVAELNKVATKPIHIQVFVLPTCPVCPVVASLAVQLALANENITTHVVEIAEFPQLATRYHVVGIPKVVINETTQFEGLVPLAEFLRHIQRAVQGSPPGVSPTT
jgi:glutaredoxin-like protein